MYNVTSGFLTAVKQPSRVVKARVVIDGTVTLDESVIMNLSVESSLNGNLPVIGSVSAAKLTLGLINSGLPAVMVGVPIVPSVAIEVTPGVFEWVPLGTFYAIPGDITKTSKSVNIECFDKMAILDDMTYSSNMTYPRTRNQVEDEIRMYYDVQFESLMQSLTYASAPQGTIRQVVSELALNLARNAIINGNGKVQFMDFPTTGFALDANNYIDFKLQSESPVKIDQLSIKNGDKTIIVGSGYNYAISLESSNLTTYESVFFLYPKVYPLTYFAYKLKTQGMPHLQLGDKFIFTDSDGVIRTLIVGSHKITYNGGLISEFSMDAPQVKTIQAAPTGGGTGITKAVTQIRTDLMMALSDATKLLTGAEGGVVVTNYDVNGKPKEQIILDTEDINTAMRVWRWNIEGLGFSSNGYLGPYSLAITADGKINADFMTVGTLSADVIQVNSISNDKLSIDLQGIISSKVSATLFDEVMSGFADDLQANVDKTNNLETNFNGLTFGGPNLIRNSRGNYGNKAWESNGVTISGYSDATSVRYCGAGNVLRIARTGETSGYAYSDDFVLVPGRTYTVFGQYYVGQNVAGMTVSVIGQRISSEFRDAVYTHQAFTDGTYSNGSYKTFSLTFTAEADEEKGFLQVEHKGSLAESFLYIVAKLEESNKAGVWSPDPDDLIDYAEDAIAASATAMNSVFQQAADSIMTEVSTKYLTKTDADTLESSLSTKFTQTSSDFTMLFNTATETQQTDSATANAKFVEIQKYIKFVNGDIILGELGNQLRLQIQSDKIAFMQDNAEVAYFSNRKLYVKDGEFLNSMRIGVFEFSPRSNGNLSLRRI